MDQLTESMIAVLHKAAGQLRGAGLPPELALDLEHLASQVHEPCVVAVVGRVKAGKSTFMNALLGDDLAKVGVTETTATINAFRYGRPADPEKPVRCYWRGTGNRYEDQPRAFVDRLQGNDIETLRLADGIDRLEYRLENPYLEHVTLVDTPGTQAVVGEHHDRTADWLKLHQQLRERHDKETRRIGSEADAVIYLVGSVATENDRDFLDEFRHATQGGQSRALNALGVLAKVDLSAQLLERRHELSAKIAGQLRDELNTVVPVSAGLQRQLDRLLMRNRAGLVELITAFRQIPPDKLPKLLDAEALYLRMDCPIPVEERRRLLGTTDWTVFTTIVRVAADPTLDQTAVVERLQTMAGFGPLKDLLKRHFFGRGQLLRAYRIVNDARKILSAIKYTHLPAVRQRERDDRMRRDRFLAFLRQTPGDPATVRELEAFVEQQLAPRTDLVPLLDGLEREFGSLYYQLENINADFEALQMLEDHPEEFTRMLGAARDERELGELRALFGLYGMDTDTRLAETGVDVDRIEDRQRFWHETAVVSRSSIRREVAERAEMRYGYILDELTSAPALQDQESLRPAR